MPIRGYLNRFAEHFPGGSTVRLDVNYRSTPEIVAAARAVLPAGERAEVRSMGHQGPAPTITTYADADAEAQGVVEKLRERRRSWPSLVVDGRAVPHQRPIGRVRGSASPFRHPVPRPRRRRVPRTERGQGRARHTQEIASKAPARDFAEHLTDLIDDAADATDESRTHREAVAQLGREYLAVSSGRGTVPEFLDFLRTSLRGHDDAGLAADAVDLLTFHRAKGLEWETVLVTGLEKGLVPISHAQGDSAATAEERRLLYVGLSRAQRTLHISWASRRDRGERISHRSPSPYLAEIQRAVTGEPEPPRDRAVNRRGAKAARATLRGMTDDELTTLDRPLFDALVEWRRDAARAAAVPAYVIFDNKSLRAVAAARPTDDQQLLSVPGVGPVKLERYGPRCSRSSNAIAPRTPATPTATTRLLRPSANPPPEIGPRSARRFRRYRASMHRFDATTEELIELCFDYATTRLRMDPVPLDQPQTLAELDAAVGPTIGPSGHPPATVMGWFRDVLAPACISADSPAFLSFIPVAPTKASQLFDVVVSSSAICASDWLEAAGAVYAENQALRWLADLAGLPAQAGGVFVSGGSAGNLSALVTARSAATEARERPHRWRVALADQAHSSLTNTLRIMDVDPLIVPTGPDDRLTGAALRAAFESDPHADDVFAVVATAGTTNSGTIDDLAGVADVAHERGVWAHVDGAYGLAGLAAPSIAGSFVGIDRVDSFVVDPHKWLFAPFDCAALLYRDPEIARHVHTQTRRTSTRSVPTRNGTRPTTRTT